ncbi:PhoP family transcriptional regulator [Paenibacillus riograndensis]|uniref:PhoP family transcriptional regulator n=1 Tax=Paenibacillus riograndensis TaxID=483937 RepID=A0A132UDA6_9BACL|nr:response regulator transcription factor [Paenibacillus riograndensis]KWX81263.1 PhoP family transcriptional regulator [Paenibacillus riograndensis]
MQRTVLLVDDNREIIELLKLFLEKEGLRILEAYNGAQAWSCIQQESIDLAVLDIMMPELNGVQLLQLLRAEYKLPVILLSAKNQDSDKILGLRLGADDFISKPFNPLEVVARIHAMLRRTYDFNEPAEPVQDTLGHTRIGELMLDHTDCVLYKAGREIPLTAIEYKLLSTLMNAPGRIFTKKQLFEQVWSEHYYEDANTIMVHISRLRDKVEETPKQPEYIRTIRGLGYKFAKKDDFR